MKTINVTCPICGKRVDVDCDCQQIEIIPEKVPTARINTALRPSTFSSIREFYNDPKNVATFEVWLVEYRKRPPICHI